MLYSFRCLFWQLHMQDYITRNINTEEISEGFLEYLNK